MHNSTVGSDSMFYGRLSGKEAMAELEAMKAQAEIEEQNKELAKELFAAIDAGNFDKLKELFADDFCMGKGVLDHPKSFHT